MESIGELVYRINRTLIDKYVQLFIQAEEEWKESLTRNIQLVRDYSIVDTLTPELRICFWFDKFRLYKDTFLRTFLVMLERTYCNETTWRYPYYCMNHVEQELLFVIFLHLRNHPEDCVHVRCLAENLWWHFSFIDS